MTWVAETGVDIGRSGALQSVRGLMVHLLVVDVGVRLEGLGRWGGPGGEGLCVELRDGIVTDFLSKLVLRLVS